MRASAVPSAAHVRSRSSVLTLDVRPDGTGSAYSASLMDAWTAIDMVETDARRLHVQSDGTLPHVGPRSGGVYVLIFAALHRQSDKCAEPVS